jgi:hypothetical protein
VKTRRAEKIGAVSVTLKSPQKNVRKLEKVVEEETSPTKHQTTSSTFAAAVGGGGYSSPKKSAIKRKRPFPGLDKTPSKSKTSEKDEVDPKA